MYFFEKFNILIKSSKKSCFFVGLHMQILLLPKGKLLYLTQQKTANKKWGKHNKIWQKTSLNLQKNSKNHV